ncbi:rubrerythrin-like domain-containing protein [Halopenitus sp. POP-27]|nr:rubrerythrin-like domain-containing protein [Halopenitus sp. POP-27]
MKDATLSTEDRTQYECFECGTTVVAADPPGECSECGGELRNRGTPIE